MTGRPITLRSRVAFWLLFGSFVPAFAVLVSFAIVWRDSLDPANSPRLLWLPAVTLLVASTAFAATVSYQLVLPVQRVRSLAVLASRRLQSIPARALDVDRGIRTCSETASIADSVRRLHERLTEESSKRDRVAAYVAHDVRTPVAALLMRIETDDRIGGGAKSDLLGEVRGVVRDLDRLVMALRGDGAEASSSVPAEPVWVAEIVKSSLPRASVRPGVDVDLVVRRDFATTMAVPALRSVVENLLSNAIRNARDDVTVEVGMGYVRVTNHTESTTAATDLMLTEAHGLGLEIVRHVLEGHGGRLRISDRAPGIVEVIAYVPFTMVDTAQA